MSYIHVSFDTIENGFTPRIPNDRLDGEDDSIKRICVTDSIRHSIGAMPNIEAAADGCYSYGYAPILHVYILEPAGEILNWNYLQEQYYVPDAKHYHESWLLDAPKSVKRMDFRWYGPCIIDAWSDNQPVTTGIEDIIYHHINHWEQVYPHMLGELKRIKHTDECQDFINFLHADPELADEIMLKAEEDGFRDMLASDDIQFVNRIKEWQKNQSMNKKKSA